MKSQIMKYCYKKRRHQILHKICTFHFISQDKIPQYARWNLLGRIYTLLRISRIRLNFIDHDDVKPCLIISPGGVASSMLMLHTLRFADINDASDADCLKHIPYPMPGLGKSRILYLYGDPETIYESLRRRDLQRFHIAKLGAGIWPLLYLLPRWMLNNFMSQPIRKLLLSAIREQIRAFREYDSDLVLCVKHEDIWKRKEDIAKHFGITDPAFIRDFPQKRSRNTRKQYPEKG